MNNKDLIKQYVDTGLILPAYQINKLSNKDKTTYFRKRVISAENGYSSFELYELVLSTDEFRPIILENVLDLLAINLYDFKGLTSDDSSKLINILFNNKNFLEKFYTDAYFNEIIIGGLHKLDIKNEIFNYIISNNKLKDAIKLNESIIDYYFGSLNIDELSKIIETLGWDFIESNGLYPHIHFATNHFDAIYIQKTGNTEVGEENKFLDLNLLIKMLKLYGDKLNHNVISFGLYEYDDEFLKYLEKYMSEEMIGKIFSNIDYYYPSDMVNGRMKDLALKYGSFEDERPTFEDIYDEIKESGSYYDEDGNDKYIDIGFIDEPLPDWVKSKSGSAGYFYSDSETENIIFGLTEKEALSIAKKNISKIFDFKKY